VLFLWLRGRSYGNHAVAEVGDFVAHSDERDKGISWRKIRGLTDLLAFHFPMNDLQMPRTHAQLSAAALAALEAYGPEDVKKTTGMGYAKAKHTLVKALKYVFPLGDKFTVAPGLSEAEQKLLKHYTSVIPVREAFTEHELVRQFLVALTKNKMIQPGAFSGKFVPQIALFTMLQMHQTAIALPEGRTAMLYITHEHGGDSPFLAVSAHLPIPEAPSGTLSMNIFKTSLKPEDWCDPELMELHPWDFPLHLGASGKLEMLV
jgi:hypothetical protein